MIYYSLSVVMMLGVRDVAIVVNPSDVENFTRLFGHGEKLGMHIEYVVQENQTDLPKGSYSQKVSLVMTLFATCLAITSSLDTTA